MAYSDKKRISSEKYIKEHQHSILIRFLKTDFEDRIAPAIKESGLPTVTYIKRAIDEKIKRDKRKQKAAQKKSGEEKQSND